MRSIGQRTPLVDGIEKVTGRARYTADLPFPSALVGRILRSPVAHGVIRAIDTSRRAGHARRARGHHRRGLRRALWRDSDRAERMAAGARTRCATAASRWSRWPRSTRPAPRPRCARSWLDIDALPAYFSAADARADGAVAAARQQARQPRAPGRAGLRRRRWPASPPPTWCSSAASTTPRSRTARSNSMPRSPSTSPSATG